jgi:hypothetical protein
MLRENLSAGSSRVDTKRVALDVGQELAHKSFKHFLNVSPAGEKDFRYSEYAARYKTRNSYHDAKTGMLAKVVHTTDLPDISENPKDTRTPSAGLCRVNQRWRREGGLRYKIGTRT